MPTDYDDDYYDDYYDSRFEWPVWAVGAIALVCSALVLWFGVGAIGGGNDDTAVRTASELDTVVTSAPRPTTSADPAESSTASATASASATQAPVIEEEVAPTAPGAAAPTGQASYPTLPDGSPVPVLAIFDDGIIALSGVVPSEAAAERLRILAIGNSTTPGAQVASFLTINPDVPADVPVRVIDADAAAFEEGSAGISLEYVAEMDRIAAMMTSLPDVTVEVIGHADRRDDSEDNVELSVERARGTVDYLIAEGIDPERLSFRGVGEADLLTLNNDDVALALNRRTEFVFSGLLVDPTQPT